MKQIIPINTIGEVSRTIYAHYAYAGWHDFDSTSPIPHTAILEIEMEEPKLIQVAQMYDQEQNPINGRVYSEDGIAPTLRTPSGGLTEPKIAVSCALRGRNPENPSDRTAGINTEQRLELGGDVANCLTSVQKDSKVAETCILGYTRDDKGGIQNYHEREVAGTIHTSSGSGGNTDQFVRTRYRIRKLTERECFRLMDVSDSDIDKIEAHRIKVTLKNGTVKEKPIPKSRKYMLAGNSIAVNVLYHIFKAMFIDEQPQMPRQLSLFD